jgi:hypothetical protein
MSDSFLMRRNDRLLLGAFLLAIAVVIFAPPLLSDIHAIGSEGNSIAEWTTGISTALLVLVAWVQLRALRSTSNADFIHKLNSDFYTEGSRRLRALLENTDTRFRVAGRVGIFELVGQPPLQTIVFNDEDVDDLVLGPLESVAVFYFNGAIDLPTTYEIFGTYVVRLWENDAIQKYISWSRTIPNCEDVYDQLQKLYIICHSYQQAKYAKAVIKSGSGQCQLHPFHPPPP